MKALFALALKNFTARCIFVTQGLLRRRRAITTNLEELVIRARKITMTAAQLREQRLSFAYGNTRIENERITREMVAEADKKIEASDK